MTSTPSQVLSRHMVYIWSIHHLKAWVRVVNAPETWLYSAGRLKALAIYMLWLRDAEKAEWVRTVNSPELVYVSGRVRQPGEINGKSGNLNNALAQIYPPDVEIPLDEVICVFDADQVSSQGLVVRLRV